MATGTVMFVQLDGFMVVAEYGSRFEADLAAERLTGDGIPATVLSDSAHQIAPHIVTQPGHRLLVADADRETARLLLAEHYLNDAADTEPAQVGLRHRPRWFRWMTYALAGSILFPLLYGLVQLVGDAFV